MSLPSPTPGFDWEITEGQRSLAFVSEARFADVRLFSRGPLLDGTEGLACRIRERLVPVLGEPLPLVAPRQVHGTTVLDSDLENVLPRVAEADGILLTEFGMEASLRFADCAPVVVMSKDGDSPWILLLHSGFKGTVRNIVRAGLEKVAARFGAQAVAEASAWVGPCIGGGNYPRLIEEWTERGLEAFHEENVYWNDPRVHFDIAAELRLQLLEGGVDEGRIFMACVDTFDSPDTCYSYRRGDREDRMFLWARLKKI